MAPSLGAISTLVLPCLPLQCQQGASLQPSFERTQLAPGPGGNILPWRASSQPAIAACHVGLPQLAWGHWGPLELAPVSVLKAAVWEAEPALMSPSSVGSSQQPQASSGLAFSSFFRSFFSPHSPLTRGVFISCLPPPFAFPSDSFPSAPAARDVQLPTSHTSLVPPAGMSTVVTATGQPKRGNPRVRTRRGLMEQSGHFLPFGINPQW